MPNLYILETLSSIKVADLLQKSLPEGKTLNVYLQVNTSGEDSKAGLAPIKPDSTELVDLALHVIKGCPGLKLHGLMTIGSLEASKELVPNPDFTSLTETRRELKRILKDKGHECELELSMGMSADYVQACMEGSNSVRVGTRIFGERYK